MRFLRWDCLRARRVFLFLGRVLDHCHCIYSGALPLVPVDCYRMHKRH